MRAGRGANPRPNLDAAAGRSPGRPLPGTATTRKEPIGHTGVAPWMHPGGGFVRLFLPDVMTGSIERERWRTCRVHDGETLKALSSPWSRSTQLATERSFTCAFPRKRQASPSPGRHRCPCHPSVEPGPGLAPVPAALHPGSRASPCHAERRRPRSAVVRYKRDPVLRSS